MVGEQKIENNVKKNIPLTENILFIAQKYLNMLIPFSWGDWPSGLK